MNYTKTSHQGAIEIFKYHLLGVPMSLMYVCDVYTLKQNTRKIWYRTKTYLL